MGKRKDGPSPGVTEEVGRALGSMCLEIVQQRRFLSEKVKDFFFFPTCDPLSGDGSWAGRGRGRGRRDASLKGMFVLGLAGVRRKEAAALRSAICLRLCPQAGQPCACPWHTFLRAGLPFAALAPAGKSRFSLFQK